MQGDENTLEQLNLFGSQVDTGETLNQQEKEQKLFIPRDDAFYKTQREVVAPSHSPVTQEFASPPAKKKHKLLIIGLFLFAIAALAGTVNFYPIFVYQSYQRGNCTIQSGSIQSYQGKNGTYYTLSLAYTVLTQDGRSVSTSGYEAPAPFGGREFSSYNEAQQIINSYTVGRLYPCWYNPADATHAALVFHGYSLHQALVLYFSITPVLFIMLMLFFAPFYAMVYRPLRLMTKGVRTQGQVTEHFVKSVYSRKSAKTTNQPYSRIVFQLQTGPSSSRGLEVSGTYPIGSQQPVLYDPTNPESAQRGGVGCTLTFGLVLCAFILAFILLVLFMSLAM